MTGPRSNAVWQRWAVASAVALVAVVAAGCSDDVVCPAPSTPESIPFVSARIIEAAGARGDTTWVEVHVAADSLPTLLFASVNDRQIGDAPEVDDFGLTVSLGEAGITWPPGNECQLEITTNFGFASSSEPVPSGTSVVAPDTVSLGDALELYWASADDADYYVITGTLDGAKTTAEITATVRDTMVAFDASVIPFAGVIRGHVEAVAGPFPEIGSAGNVGGAGWGFFTIAYRDPAGAFEVVIADTGR